MLKGVRRHWNRLFDNFCQLQVDRRINTLIDGCEIIDWLEL